MELLLFLPHQRVPSLPLKSVHPPRFKTPEKRVCTSMEDFFGTGSIKRSNKKLVETKKGEPHKSTDDSTLDDEAIARQLQLAEDEELERQLHEDEEFAKTLAIIDDVPTDKANRNRENEPTTSPASKKSPAKSEKPAGTKELQ
ncbi:unnamed protein product [Ranitomeya imitator]|uniref:Uncharacterized protein n=1 Tax=Ranitomeya imitator TaxID=111125 RepID=A0ABN9MB48_9NEOB|nr:unnamed protein product [Ranitomeya imitator]